MTPTGERIDLRRQRVLQLVLARLAQSRIQSPDDPVPTPALIEEIWGDERVSDDVVRNRLRVAVTSLRKLGLGTMLIGIHNGYLLDPDARIAIES